MQLLKRLTTIIILLPICIIQSQTTIYTLDKAIETALERNRDIMIAMMNVYKSEAAVDEAFGYALPTLDLSASASHFLMKPKMAFPDFTALLTNATYDILFDENVIPRDEDKYLPLSSKLQSFAQSNSFETKAEITQILFNSAVFTGIGASKIYLDLSKVQLRSVVSKIILDTKIAFYRVLLAKELLGIMEASLQNAEDNFNSVKILNEKGLTSDFDVLQVNVRVENLRPVVTELKNALENAKNGFKIILNLDQSEPLDVEGEFYYNEEQLPDDSESIETALNSNLDIQTMTVKKQVDKEMIQIEKSDYWPTVAAFGNFLYAGSSDEFDFQTYNSSMVGLGLTFNIFRGGQVSNRVQQAEINMMQSEQNIVILKDLITIQVKNQLLELEKTKIHIVALNQNVNLAEKAYEISTTRYQEGTGTQLEIKNADLELRNARITRIKSVHDYIIAKAKLDNLLGKIEENKMYQINKKVENH
ncbi:TolC family protein [Bacteroidota bacterium]